MKQKLRKEQQVSGSDVTYISDDDQNELITVTDEPPQPNKVPTPINIFDDIDMDIDSNVSEWEENNSLHLDSLDSTTNLPPIGSRNYFPVWLFDDVELIHVDNLPHDVNGKKIFIIQTNAGNWKLNCRDKHHFMMTSSS